MVYCCYRGPGGALNSGVAFSSTIVTLLIKHACQIARFTMRICEKAWLPATFKKMISDLRCTQQRFILCICSFQLKCGKVRHRSRLAGSEWHLYERCQDSARGVPATWLARVAPDQAQEPPGNSSQRGAKAEGVEEAEGIEKLTLSSQEQSSHGMTPPLLQRRTFPPSCSPGGWPTHPVPLK